MSALRHPTIVAFIVFMVALGAESWFSWRFLRGLKRLHPDLWLRSGKRTIWTDGDLISAYPTVAYLWKRKYVPESRDSEMAFCEHYRLPVVVSWAAAAISVCAFFISLFSFGWPRSV
jgi:hypothetical protein